jgi:hypothetical protein
MRIPNVQSVHSYWCVFKFNALPHSVIPQYGHNAVCKVWCLHSVEAEEHGVTQLTDTDVSKERDGHKNNLMMKTVELNCLVFLLALVSLYIFFETSGLVKSIIECNFQVCHNPHMTLSFTRKVKRKMSSSEDVEHFEFWST